MKREYRDSKKAKEKFDRTMSALFRIPKSVIAEKIKSEAQKRLGQGRFTLASALPSSW
jgi:hypothetical protein